MNTLIIGSSNMDLVLHVPTIPRIGETILGHHSSMVFGGKGANQAIAAKRAGGSVQFVTKLGLDVFGEEMRQHFLKEGLPANTILSDAKAPTGVAQILVSDKGENSIAVAPGANMQLRPTDLEAFSTLLEKASVILIQLEIPINTVEFILEKYATAAKKIILNPAPAQLLKDSCYKDLFLLTPNETEAELLSGIALSDEASAIQACQWFLNKGVQNILITLGSKGCIHATKNGHAMYSSFKVQAIDTTAAGDVFNGCLAVSLAEGNSMEKSIRFGSAAAALSVTKKGAQTSIPSLQEITTFLQNQTAQG